MKFDLSIYKGAVIALNTCFNENGDIDCETTCKLVRWYTDMGIKGFYLNGTSGEGILMSVDERIAVAEAVMEELKGSDCFVINHVGAYATRDAVALAIHSEKIGCDAVSSIPCLPFSVPEHAIKTYWDAIIDASNLPFIIYNMPGLTRYSLSFGLFGQMLENPKVIGIKDTGGSLYQTERFRAMAGEDFIIFNGSDEQYFPARLMGANAGIGGTYGVMPELFLTLEQCIQKRDFDNAQTIQGWINEIISDYLLAEPPIMSIVKPIISHRVGFNIGAARPPLHPIAFDAPIVLKAVAKINEFVENCKLRGVKGE